MRTSMTLILGLSLAACGNPPVVTPDAPISVEDAGDSCSAPVPNPPATTYGSSVGSLVRNFTANTCDGTPYTFYNEEYCAPEHTFTVVSIAALWCVPCQMESQILTAQVTEPYRSRGVRVLQILVDGETRGSSFTPAQCDQWVSTYGLTNVQLMDVGSPTTSFLFPSGALPSTLVIDEEGIIRFREDGLSTNLVSLRSALDSLLAAP